MAIADYDLLNSKNQRRHNLGKPLDPWSPPFKFRDQGQHAPAPPDVYNKDWELKYEYRYPGPKWEYLSPYLEDMIPGPYKMPPQKPGEVAPGVTVKPTWGRVWDAIVSPDQTLAEKAEDVLFAYLFGNETEFQSGDPRVRQWAPKFAPYDLFGGPDQKASIRPQRKVLGAQRRA